jgi:hypothetical protein
MRLETEMQKLKTENDLLRTEMQKLKKENDSLRTDEKKRTDEIQWERKRRLQCEGDLEVWRTQCSHRSKCGSGGGWATSL